MYRDQFGEFVCRYWGLKGEEKLLAWKTNILLKNRGQKRIVFKIIDSL